MVDRVAGRRLYADSDGTHSMLTQGDYIKLPDGVVLYWPPGAELGPWAAHKDKVITEHEDATISVSPSILCTYSKIDPKNPGKWHGFLERGIWRQA